jgi:hypothetical protein
MRSRTRLLATVVTLLCVAGLAAAGVVALLRGGGRPEVAATVEGVEIASHDIDQLLAEAVAGPSGSIVEEDGREFAERAALTFLVRLTMLEQLAVEAGVDLESTELEATAAESVEAADLAGLGVNRSDFERGLRASRLSAALGREVFPDVAVTDAEVRGFYESHAERFAAGWRSAATAVFFDDAESATGFREALAGGTAVEAAADASGGDVNDLGIVMPGANLPPEILASLANLPAGASSEVIEGSSALFMVLVVSEREDIPASDVAAATPEITEELVADARATLFSDWFDERLEEADVTVDSHYGTWSPDHGLVEE